jgi:hypothetical protein
MRTTSRAAALAIGLACAVATTTAVALPAMTRSEAEALAKSANLEAADLPDFTASRPGSSNGDPRADARFAKCAGSVPSSKLLADVPSSDYVRETDTSYTAISSDVQVMPTASLVRKDVKAAKTTRARNCLAAVLRRQLNGQGTHVTRVSVAALKPGVPGGYAFRVKVVAQEQGVTVRVYSDMLGFGDGPVEAGLIVTTALRPFARSEENRLLDIVRTRVNAQLNKDAIV